MAKKTAAQKREETGEIPRPPNCWLVFRAERRRFYEMQNPKPSQSHISKLLSLDWGRLTLEEKDDWFKRAQRAKEEHAKKYPNYKYRPKSKELKAALKEQVKRAKEALKAEQQEAKRQRQNPPQPAMSNQCQMPYSQSVSGIVPPPLPDHANAAAAPVATETSYDAPSPLNDEAPTDGAGRPNSAPSLAPVQDQLDPSLDPAALGMPQSTLKRTHDDMLAEDQAFDVNNFGLPDPAVSLSQQDYTNLDDFIQSIVLGYPGIPSSEPPPHTWGPLAPPSMEEQIEADPWSTLIPNDDNMQDLTALARGVVDTDFVYWAYDVIPPEGEVDPLVARNLDQFQFGDNLHADFNPQLTFPDESQLFTLPVDQPIEPLLDLNLDDMNYIHVPQIQDTVEGLFPVVDAAPLAAQAPAPVPQQVYLPPAGASANRRRVGGSWRPQAAAQPEFAVGSSTQGNQYPF